MKKETKGKPDPYKHDVTTCINKIINNWKRMDSDVIDAAFDMANIQRFGSRPQRFKTAQVVRITRKTKTGKEKTTRTFTAHSYCPFCGKKF